MKLVGIVLIAFLVSCAGYLVYVATVSNPQVVAELYANPSGKRAARVMLLTFPDGKEIPVNYLREGDTVFAGADGGWWRAFAGEGAEVTLYIQGETLKGHATVELDDRQYIDDVFSRLRPDVPAWLPVWANGKLVVIGLPPAKPGNSDR